MTAPTVVVRAETRQLITAIADDIKTLAATDPDCALVQLLDLIDDQGDKAVTIAAYAILALATVDQLPPLRDNAGLIWYPVCGPLGALYAIGETGDRCGLTRKEIDLFHGPLTEVTL